MGPIFKYYQKHIDAKPCFSIGINLFWHKVIKKPILNKSWLRVNFYNSQNYRLSIRHRKGLSWYPQKMFEKQTTKKKDSIPEAEGQSFTDIFAMNRKKKTWFVQNVLLHDK